MRNLQLIDQMLDAGYDLIGTSCEVSMVATMLRRLKIRKTPSKPKDSVRCLFKKRVPVDATPKAE